MSAEFYLLETYILGMSLPELHLLVITEQRVVLRVACPSVRLSAFPAALQFHLTNMAKSEQTIDPGYNMHGLLLGQEQGQGQRQGQE